MIVQLDERLFVRLDAIEAMELFDGVGAEDWKGWHVSTAYSLFLSPRKYGDTVFRDWWRFRGNCKEDSAIFLAANPQKESK